METLTTAAASTVAATTATPITAMVAQVSVFTDLPLPLGWLSNGDPDNGGKKLLATSY